MSVHLERLFYRIRYGSRSYAQGGEDILIRNLLAMAHIDQPSYLDIGAFHPYFLSNTALLYASGSRGINIEPNPRQYRIICKHRPGDINLNIGIASTSGYMSLNMVATPYYSTFSTDWPTAVWRRGYHGANRRVRVRVETVHSVVSRYCRGIFPDLLSIDTEGMDEEIVRSIDFSTASPKIICVEMLSASVARERSDSQDLTSYLEGKGYKLVADTYINALFVRTDLW